jgi:hypothetical protein
VKFTWEHALSVHLVPETHQQYLFPFLNLLQISVVDPGYSEQSALESMQPGAPG